MAAKKSNPTKRIFFVIGALVILLLIVGIGGRALGLFGDKGGGLRVDTADRKIGLSCRSDEEIKAQAAAETEGGGVATGDVDARTREELKGGMGSGAGPLFSFNAGDASGADTAVATDTTEIASDAETTEKAATDEASTEESSTEEASTDEIAAEASADDAADDPEKSE